MSEGNKDTRFKPGHNTPGPGRPKGTPCLARRLRYYLRDHPEQVEAIILATVNDAINGDTAARKMIFDRVSGAVPQRFHVNQLSDDQLLALAASGLIQGDAEEGVDTSDESEA